MRHSWDEGDMFMGTIVSECLACGGYRTRKRLANVDFINTGTISIDMVGKTNKGWTLDEGTPRSCPGKRIEVKRMSDMTVYSHRNGESDEPKVAGWYWFDGVTLFPPQEYIKRPVLVEREDDELGSKYWYGATEDADDACADGWLEGHWWGPVHAPWVSA